MDNQMKIYNIPINPNISKGTIYTLYINNNTNLELSSILNNTTLNNTTTIFKENKIIIEKNDYDKFNNTTIKIKNIINILIKSQEEINKNIEELSKLNEIHSQLLKNIVDERKL